jgi:hypothetical protein
MKRGLITWDQAELPRSVFDARLAKARAAIAAAGAPALLVYTDIWRANQGRFLTNFMPYWNRSLAVIPEEGDPVLLCGLSPRVYPWIKSVTLFEEIRPASKLVPTLLKLCEERGWKALGVLDLERVPHEVHGPLSGAGLALKDVRLTTLDDAALAMHRRAAELARRILNDELPHGAGITGHQFAGRLERIFRRAGAEDLIILMSAGATVPLPATAVRLPDAFSVSITVEYRGHWARVTRAHAAPPALEAAFAAGGGLIENLSGPYPYELGSGPLTARHVEITHAGQRLFHGDTCWQGASL